MHQNSKIVRQELRGLQSEPIPPPMTFKDRLYYSDWNVRGYLSGEAQSLGCELLKRYAIVPPVKPILKESFKYSEIKENIQ